MQILLHWLVSALAVFLTAYILPGVDVTDFWTAFVVAVVLGIANAVIKPILIVLTLPINILTLGLFTVVINAGLVLLASNIVPGFKVDGFIWAVLFGVVSGLVSSVLNGVTNNSKL